MTTKTLLTSQGAQKFLREEAKRATADPMTNSVFALSQTLFRQLETNEAEISDLAALVDTVHLDLIKDRATRFRDQHFQVDTDRAWEPVEKELQSLAKQGFDVFREAVERPTGGIVFTAHPTFALSHDLRQAFAAHVTHPNKASETKLSEKIAVDTRPLNAGIDLLGEHEEVQDALHHAANAQIAYAKLVLSVANKAFPDVWKSLTPYLPTLASWVGYDLDGRTDIHWSQSITFRLTEKSVQLHRYAKSVTALIEAHRQSDTLSALVKQLERASDESAAHAEEFAKDLTVPKNLVAAANALTAPSEAKITDASDIIAVLDTVINNADTPLATDLIALRAQVTSLQLGTARIHLRVNAAQVRTVITRDLGLETEDRELGRLALAELSQKARASKPLSVNFSDLFLEQSTARRQFIMCAQILKHIDAGSVIRFLIAESENPATVMGALYLARQYGVADQLDISPLFETPEALETGGRFIERLLDEPEFVRYITRRGYLSIQLGFSDAGRFIGQIAANMAIERIHNIIARALATKTPGIDLLIFNTHGESMGRGAWPGSFQQRFDHLLTPWTRNGARQRGLNLIHEVSFQGGDGFLHFATDQLAETTYAAWCGHALSTPADTTDDPFYTRTDLVWDFYRALRAWHERLFRNADYGHFLNAFSDGLTVKAGSRQKRRVSGSSDPSSLRAISHNATLQQLGVPANSAAGIGSSLQRESDRLVELVDASPRMRALVQLALKARIQTSIPAMRAYSSVYNPSVWVAQSGVANTEHVNAYRAIYYALRDDPTSGSLQRIANIVSIDLTKFDRLLARFKDTSTTEERHEGRLKLHLLHAVRQALIMHALSLAGSVPRFSERHDASARDLVKLVANLRISDAVELLCRVFPRLQNEEMSLSALTETGSSASSDATYGYDDIHRDIITPLDNIDAALHRTSLAITHAYGAFG